MAQAVTESHHGTRIVLEGEPGAATRANPIHPEECQDVAIVAGPEELGVGRAIAVVTDGVSQASAPAIAAHATANAIASALRRSLGDASPSIMLDAFRAAEAELQRVVAAQPSVGGLQAMAAAALVSDSRVVIGIAGDCQVYWQPRGGGPLRPVDPRELHALTRTDVAGALRPIGSERPGTCAGLLADPGPGRLLITTDGIRVLSRERMQSLLGAAATAQQAAESLVSGAVQLGASDDLAVAVLDLTVVTPGQSVPASPEPPGGVGRSSPAAFEARTTRHRWLAVLVCLIGALALFGLGWIVGVNLMSEPAPRAPAVVAGSGEGIAILADGPVLLTITRQGIVRDVRVPATALPHGRARAVTVDGKGVYWLADERGRLYRIGADRTPVEVPLPEGAVALGLTAEQGKAVVLTNRGMWRQDKR